MSERILLVDGHSIANRAFFGVRLLTNSKGQYTNALFGFFNILFSVMEKVKPTQLAIAFDLHHPTFRHEMFKEYKGNRSPMQEELREQIPVLQEMLKKAGVQLLMQPGLEADDLIGTAAKRGAAQGNEVTILSGDRDLLQLVDEHITVCLPKTKKEGTEYEIYHVPEVVEKYGVEPFGYLQMKALMGDSSDNIPGVPKIGEKTAMKIIQEYKTVEEAILHAGEVKPPSAGKNLAEYADQARMSLVLATIKIDAEEVPMPQEIREETFHTSEFVDELRKYELKTILKKVTQSGMVKEAAVQQLQNMDTSVLPTGMSLKGQMELFDEGAEIQSVEASKEVTLNKGIILKNMKELQTKLEEDKPQSLSIICLRDEGADEIIGAAVNGWYADGSMKELLEAIRSLLEDETIAKYLCDAKPLYKAALKEKIEIRGEVLDEMIAAYLLNATTGHYTVDTISSTYLDLLIPAEEEILGSGAKKISWLMTDEEIRGNFALQEAQVLEHAAPIMKRRLEETQMLSLYTEMEGPLVECLASMENEGVKVDLEELETIGVFLRKEIARLQEEIFDLSGREFNIQSPKQLGQILFEDLGLPAGKKTKSGYSTSAEVLEGLRPYHPVVEKILDYRRLTKLESTYVEGLKPCVQSDGKIHCNFQQAVTATGRLSCTEPNLQNIPIREKLGRELRKAFVPSSSEYFFMDADYSQIELRLVAHMSGDEAMVRAYCQGADIHRLTASEVLHIPYEEVTSAQRSSAKAVNFGIIYGMSAFSLANDLGLTNKEASKYISDYFARFPNVKGFLDHCVESAKEKGYGVTIFGRRRQIEELKAKNFAQRSFGERVAKNMPIQGSAADIIKIAMVKVYQRLKKEGLMSKLILQVHDELMIQVYRPEAEMVEKILVEEMQGAAELLVPLTVEVETGETWYDAK